MYSQKCNVCDIFVWCPQHKLLFVESLEEGCMESFFWWLKNLIIAMFWRHNYFLLKVKNSQENIFKESYFKKWLFKNVMSETQFPQLTSSRSWEFTRVVTKISSCWVTTTSRRGIKGLGISFGSIFLLFSNKSNRGPLSYSSRGKSPAPCS